MWLCLHFYKHIYKLYFSPWSLDSWGSADHCQKAQEQLFWKANLYVIQQYACIGSPLKKNTEKILEAHTLETIGLDILYARDTVNC